MIIDTDEIREVVKYYLPDILIVQGMSLEQERKISEAMRTQIKTGLDAAMQVLARRIKERNE